MNKDIDPSKMKLLRFETDLLRGMYLMHVHSGAWSLVTGFNSRRREVSLLNLQTNAEFDFKIDFVVGCRYKIAPGGYRPPNAPPEGTVYERKRLPARMQPSRQGRKPEETEEMNKQTGKRPTTVKGAAKAKTTKAKTASKPTTKRATTKKPTTQSRAKVIKAKDPIIAQQVITRLLAGKK